MTHIESLLDEYFRKALRVLPGIEVRTSPRYRVINLFGLLDEVPAVKIPSGKEISLREAKMIFRNAYYAIENGIYHDATEVAFDSATDKYFFEEGVKAAREF